MSGTIDENPLNKYTDEMMAKLEARRKKVNEANQIAHDMAHGKPVVKPNRKQRRRAAALAAKQRSK